MSAEFFQMAGALPQCLDKREAFDASSAAFAKPALVETHQQRGPMMPPHDAGGDNPQHSMMPLGPPGHNAGMV